MSIASGALFALVFTVGFLGLMPRGFMWRLLCHFLAGTSSLLAIMVVPSVSYVLSLSKWLIRLIFRGWHLFYSTKKSTWIALTAILAWALSYILLIPSDLPTRQSDGTCNVLMAWAERDGKGKIRIHANTKGGPFVGAVFTTVRALPSMRIIYSTDSPSSSLREGVITGWIRVGIGKRVKVRVTSSVTSYGPSGSFDGGIDDWTCNEVQAVEFTYSG
jgi:hypothetical protein